MVDRLNRLRAGLLRWTDARRATRITRRAVTGFLEHEALQYAGSMAYFAMLSLFQVVVLGVLIFSLVIGEGEARAFVVEQLEGAAPLQSGTIGRIVDSILASRGGIGLISAAFLTWGALGFFGALSRGISRAFPLAAPRPFWREKLLALGLMALVGGLVLASVGIGLATGIVVRLADDVVGGVPGGRLALDLIGLFVPILLVFGAMVALYRLVPNRPVALSQVWPGAVVATVLWTLLRVGFTWYATSVARYETAFGPISTAITLLVFLYFAGVVVLLGAEVARAVVIDDELSASQAEPAGG
jgi:membrane protein